MISKKILDLSNGAYILAIKVFFCSLLNGLYQVITTIDTLGCRQLVVNQGFYEHFYDIFHLGINYIK